jgi:peptidoglycan/xylan/chitin deacetylase (PgdA/CDA1 family)
LATIALKVDVDTLRGTREGVPRLLDIFERLGVKATFLFSLGPDHTGWALRRVFRPGFFSKVSRTSVVANYGLKTLMYGVLLPAPDIGRRAWQPMRAALDAGHECGIHTWDHVVWHDNVRHRDEAWTIRQMRRAYERFVDVLGKPPATHGAAGWQMNGAALHQLDDWGMAYASDGRGPSPYIPVVDGQACSHVEMPTSLPTFDEVIGLDGVTEASVAHHIAKTTESDTDHVFTLHAELEGGLLAGGFETLLRSWQSQGHTLGTMADYYAELDRSALPLRPMAWGSVKGRSGELMVAGEAV